MQMFPGRTPEELDAIDWGRLWQALEARRIERIEDKRIDFLAGRLKELDAGEWEVILENDAMVKHGAE